MIRCHRILDRTLSADKQFHRRLDKPHIFCLCQRFVDDRLGNLDIASVRFCIFPDGSGRQHMRARFQVFELTKFLPGARSRVGVCFHACFSIQRIFDDRMGPGRISPELDAGAFKRNRKSGIFIFRQRCVYCSKILIFCHSGFPVFLWMVGKLIHTIPFIQYGIDRYARLFHCRSGHKGQRLQHRRTHQQCCDEPSHCLFSHLSSF